MRVIGALLAAFLVAAALIWALNPDQAQDEEAYQFGVTLTDSGFTDVGVVSWSDDGSVMTVTAKAGACQVLIERKAKEDKVARIVDGKKIMNYTVISLFDVNGYAVPLSGLSNAPDAATTRQKLGAHPEASTCLAD